MGVPQGSVLSSLLFLIYVSDMADPKHHLNSRSQFVDDTGLWARSKKTSLAANRLQEDLSGIRLVLLLPKYISTRLLHETSGLLYVKDRHLAVATSGYEIALRIH